MNYLDFLEGVHKRVKPDLYFEIGCRKGMSLARSRGRLNVAVDPAFIIENEITRPTRLFKMTSDDFFAQRAEKVFRNKKVNMAFIDGMHLAEFALRDFINLEKYLANDAVVIVDDVMPDDMTMAPRIRTRRAWTGDVYKIYDVLKQYRPDLRIEVADVYAKGAMVIRNFDAKNTLLQDNLPAIEAELIKIDTPVITAEALREKMAPIDPQKVLNSLSGRGPIRNLMNRVVENTTSLFK